MSLSVAAMIQYERLQTPAEHLRVLVEPAAEQVRAALVGEPGASLGGAVILERPLGEWRAQLRRRLGLSGPVIVTGHQAGFFHAGVFAKVVAAHALATQAGGVPVFLTVDSDLPKTQRLVVPEITGAGLRRVDVAIPGCDPQRPHECRPDTPREQWLEFFVRVASIYEHYDVSLLRPFTEGWLACDEEWVSFCDALARGRTAMEEALGLGGVHEVRVSQLCDTREFRAFAAHLMLESARFADDYNAAQTAYRRRHRVRSARRPVPPLAISTEGVELPLWVFQCDGPRARLHVQRVGEQVKLFAGRQPIGAISTARLADSDKLDEPWEFEAAGWRLRPRALMLSAFARLFVADLFVHGIGGAKYDEITDDYLRRFLDVDPPPMCAVSATLHLPLPRTGVRRPELLEARRQSRDIRFNPQRYLKDVPEDLLRRRQEMIRRSDELRAGRSDDRATRRMVFDEIRRLNEHILERDPWRAAELDQQLQMLEQRWQLDGIACDREYFVALHLKSTLEELVRRVRERLGTAQK